MGAVGPSRQVARLGIRSLGLGLALMTSAVLARIAWLRVQLRILALALGSFAAVHQR